MPSASAALPNVQGSQRPSVCSVPPYTSSAGEEAVELAKEAGLILDPWEEFVLRESLGERADGKWAAFEVGLVVPRQNGKNAVLEARELAGLFLLDEELITHSAHQFDTSLEAFRRLLFLIENNADFSRRVKRISNAHGKEGIELTNRQRIRFRTRTKGGGRGFSGDCLVLDEAMDISEGSHGALFPTLSARQNPQVWYTGSAVDQWVHDNGMVLARLRERGRAGGDPSLAYFEWAADGEHPEWVDEKITADPRQWAKANPALGIRIMPEHVGLEQRSLASRTFAVERLGIGDWPDTNPDKDEMIDSDKWAAGVDLDSRAIDPVAFAFDVRPDRSAASIGAAGFREDGEFHIEVIEHAKGTAWVGGRLRDLKERHKPSVIKCDGKGPAASLLPELEELNLEVETVNATEHAQACGRIFDAIEEGTLHHFDTAELNAAVRGAATRPLGEAWAWSRKSSSIDISPLVSVTLALWGVLTHKPKTRPGVEVIA